MTAVSCGGRRQARTTTAPGPGLRRIRIVGILDRARATRFRARFSQLPRFLTLRFLVSAQTIHPVYTDLYLYTQADIAISNASCHRETAHQTRTAGHCRWNPGRHGGNLRSVRTVSTPSFGPLSYLNLSLQASRTKTLPKSNSLCAPGAALPHTVSVPPREPYRFFSQNMPIQSSACQRAHWPAHRSICMMRRETMSRLTNLDNVARSSGSTAVLTPTQVMTELRSFTQKFNPLLFQTAYNCLRIRETPQAWLNYVAFVQLKRLPHVNRSSKPWQRYMVEWVSPLPVDFIVEQMDGGSSRLTETKAAQERHHQQAGHLGTLTMIISGACTTVVPPLTINNVTYFGFGSHSDSALEVTDRWQESFMETIERMCGRTPPERSPEP